MRYNAAHLDWFSFSLESGNDSDNDMVAFYTMQDTLRHSLPSTFYDDIFAHGEFERTGGRKPFTSGWQDRKRGIYVWYGNIGYILIEFSGVGCTTLRELGIEHQIIEMFAQRATRLDIAHDIETDVQPLEFTQEGFNKRIKSTGYLDTATGRTSYVGSKNSDKYVAVYRYGEYHERGDKLRVEYRSKKLQARIAADMYARYGAQHCAQLYANYYQWKHPLMQQKLADVQEGMPSVKVHREESKTIQWLIQQAAPAFQKLVKSGSIDNPNEFLDKYFLAIDVVEGEANE